MGLLSKSTMDFIIISMIVMITVILLVRKFTKDKTLRFAVMRAFYYNRCKLYPLLAKGG